ncbi:MAG TPA: hypothetical protein VIB08_02880, partial [Thermoanaerobaculia bacterium]
MTTREPPPERSGVSPRTAARGSAAAERRPPRNVAAGRRDSESILNRYESIPLASFPRRLIPAALLSVLALIAGGCGRDAASTIAGRVLESYRKAEGARPLPEAGSIRIRLSPAALEGGLTGSSEIEWEGLRFRETVESDGVRRVRGIQGGKAFLTDEDGVTRVGSEPMLAELITRSYFWRRAFLFADRERARLSLGPADESTVSLVLQPRGGHPLRLVFDRKTDRLRSVVSPRFRLDFEGPAKYRDLSGRPVVGEIVWTGLPVRRLPDPVVGGWRGMFSVAEAEAPLSLDARGPSVPAAVSGTEARLALDADVTGPLLVSPEL